jgi:hypothetical protein
LPTLTKAIGPLGHPQLQRRTTESAAIPALERDLAYAKVETETRLRELTEAFAADVRTALEPYRMQFRAFQRACAATEDYDTPATTRTNPATLEEALGRMLTAAGIKIARTTMKRGAYQAHAGRRARR